MIVGEKGTSSASRRTRRLAAPTEHDEVGIELGGGFHDAFRCVSSDPDDRVDRGSVRGEVEDALEQSPGVTGARRALRQGHPLRDLDDPERGQLARSLLEEVGTEADEFLGRRRVGNRDEDPGRKRHAAHSAGGSDQASTR